MSIFNSLIPQDFGKHEGQGPARAALVTAFLGLMLALATTGTALVHADTLAGAGAKWLSLGF
jgi:hypothetical protein